MRSLLILAFAAAACGHSFDDGVAARSVITSDQDWRARLAADQEITPYSVNSGDNHAVVDLHYLEGRSTYGRYRYACPYPLRRPIERTRAQRFRRNEPCIPLPGNQDPTPPKIAETTVTFSELTITYLIDGQEIEVKSHIPLDP